jgi:hypothetical protein
VRLVILHQTAGLLLAFSKIITSALIRTDSGIRGLTGKLSTFPESWTLTSFERA